MRMLVLGASLQGSACAYDLLQGEFCDNCPRRGEKKETLYYMI